MGVMMKALGVLLRRSALMDSQRNNYGAVCVYRHDPHGVPSGGVGTVHYQAVLRVSNKKSGVCLTCHNT
ncbi:MAG: hypothetical protein GWP74_15540 [Proteobacteria bacterium]|nr:hypothetical protein [Pseudomonadota bacterium]